ncbi:MAG: hypothetical protein WA919_28600 [Coleofasciculaceae cyanobacterium]
MNVFVCPGIHEQQLTEEFLEVLTGEETGILPTSSDQQVLIFPSQDYPPYSAVHVLDFLRSHNSIENPVIFISFSAGVVGAIGTAWGWQLGGGKVKAFIAIDGWGVPLSGNFPIHRLSHDYFTHWSSALLGAGEDSFYADRAVGHLDLWAKPDICQGWWVHPSESNRPQKRTFTTAAQFLKELLRRSMLSL